MQHRTRCCVIMAVVLIVILVLLGLAGRKWSTRGSLEESEYVPENTREAEPITDALDLQFEKEAVRDFPQASIKSTRVQHWGAPLCATSPVETEARHGAGSRDGPPAGARHAPA